MKKLLKPVSGAFFWAGMIVITYLACFLILINYDIIIIKAVAAAEASYQPVLKIANNNFDLNIEEPLINNFTPSELIDCDCEKEFTNPVPVTWQGKVNSVFAGGEGLGVEKYNFDEDYSMFYVITNNLYESDFDQIEVRGDLVGITCAYANTIFGQCVPLINAQEIKNIGIN